MPIQRQAGRVPYQLTYKRVKSLNLRIGPGGEVLLSAPRRVALAEADAFVAGKAAWIASAQQKMARRAAAEAAEPPVTPKMARAMLEKADAAIWPLFCGALGGRHPELRLRQMKSRWGVCDVTKRRITLNTRLAVKPPEAAEYVLLHEYAHLFYPNHQAGFWGLVGRLMPDYAARRALLRTTEENFL